VFLAAIRDADLVGKNLQDQSRVAHFVTISGTRHVACLAVTDVSRDEFKQLKAKMTPAAYMAEYLFRAVVVEALGDDFAKHRLA
jgi:hypothetical protein